MASNSNYEHQRMTRWVLMAVILIPITAFVVLRWPQIRDRFFVQREAEESSPTTTTDVDASTASSPVESSDSDRESVVQESPAPDDNSNAILMVPETSEPKTPDPSIANAEAAAKELQKQLEMEQEKLESARLSFEKFRQQFDVVELNELVGSEWAAIQKTLVLAETSSEPKLATEQYKAAESQLRDLIPELVRRRKLREIQNLSESGDALDFLKRLIALPDENLLSETEIDELWSRVIAWPSSRWLTIAEKELNQLSPSDDGFTEVWLAKFLYHLDQGEQADAAASLDGLFPSVARMTSSRRAAESAVNAVEFLRQHPELSIRLQDAWPNAISAVNGVSDPVRMSELFADLAGMALVDKQNTTFKTCQTSAMDAAKKSSTRFRAAWANLIDYRIRSWTDKPNDILQDSIHIPNSERTIGVKAGAGTSMAAAMAAMAATRSKESQDFHRAILIAESHQLDAAGYEYVNAFARYWMAQAELEAGNSLFTLISGMNTPDPRLKAELLYRLSYNKPGAVPLGLFLQMMAESPTASMSAPAIYRVISKNCSDAELKDSVIPTLMNLKERSTKAAICLALSRRSVDVEVNESPEPLLSTSAKTDLQFDSPVSVMDNAEIVTTTLQTSSERAWAQLWITVCWHQLQKPASYAEGVKKFDEAMLQYWRSYWKERPTASSTVSDGFYRDSHAFEFANDYDRAPRAERMLWDITNLYMTMAEIQAHDLRDSPSALRNTLLALRSSHLLSDAKDELRPRLCAVIARIHKDTGLSADLLESNIFPNNPYYETIHASLLSDINGVKDGIVAIEKQGLPYQFETNDCLARAWAELARQAAIHGKVEDYRSARRKAFGMIESNGASQSILLAILEADALVGECNLVAETRKPDGSLPLFGSKARVLSQLCVELSVQGRADEAESYLPAERFWRLRALHAMFASHANQLTIPDLQAQIEKLEDPSDKVAALTGIAHRQHHVTSPRPLKPAR